MSITERSGNRGKTYPDNYLLSFRTLATWSDRSQEDVLRAIEATGHTTTQRTLYARDFPILIDELAVPREPVSQEGLRIFPATADDFQVSFGNGEANIVYSYDENPPAERMSLAALTDLAIEQFAEERADEWTQTKKQEREQMLRGEPELRRSIDTQPLRTIIPDFSFKCSRNASIADGNAIEGSDIDGGIVITPESLALDQELAFIDALRTQGFTAYHEVQVEETLAAAESMLQNYPDFTDMPAEVRESVMMLGAADTQVIQFLTAADIQYMMQQGTLSQELKTYLAGHTIH